MSLCCFSGSSEFLIMISRWISLDSRLRGNDEWLCGLRGNDEWLCGLRGNDEWLCGLRWNDEWLCDLRGNDGGYM
jgi:hypothetical protein